MSQQLIPIDAFDSNGTLQSYRIASYLLRNGELHTLGIDSAVSDYNYIYQKLLDWLIETINTQKDVGPLESLLPLFEQADHPKQMVVNVGATRYTDFGEKAFLQAGDELFVLLYNVEEYNAPNLKELCLSKSFPNEKISVLHQVVSL